MGNREKQSMRKQEIIKEIVKLLSGIDERKLSAVYRFVLGIK